MPTAQAAAAALADAHDWVRPEEADAVVVTTGTFLNGLAHIGEQQYSCGRSGEAPSNVLGDQLRSLGLEWKRLKTGTPPRLLRGSIDFDKLEPQAGDEPVPWFSYWKEDLFHVEHSGINPRESSRSNGRYPPGSILDQLKAQTA